MPRGPQQTVHGEPGLEGRALGFTPLGSRLRPPQALGGLVAREALVASLLADPRALVVVSAPAGYGKTTALAQWVEADARPSSWLQLDEADNDPVVLLTYLALALQRVAPVDPGVFEWLRLRTPPIEQHVLPSLAASLGEARPFLCVLDDGHLVGAEACWGLVGTLLDGLPPGAQLAVAGRADPPLPLARLRAAGRLAEYRLDRLAFDRVEAGELFRLHECEPDDDKLEAALLATEGWAAGLRLALLSGEGGGDGLPWIRGDQHAIAAYLTEEVLERQAPEVQQFLLRTAILDRLSSDLCSAVTGDADAGLHLRTLARESLFVTALDDHDEWFRYHHLFAELLSALERRREPAQTPLLHRRAAEWYEAHGDVECAVRHWVAGGDVAAAAWPAFNAVYELVDRGRVESARRLLDGFTQQQLADHVALTMAAGWLYGTVIGDPVKGERWRRAACTVPVTDEPMPDNSTTWRAYQAGLRSLLAPDGVARMLADAKLSLACAQEAGLDDCEAQRVVGVAAYLCGRPRQATESFRAMLAACDDAPVNAYVSAFLALIAADEGRWDDAAELERQALELAPEMTLDISPGMFLALPMLLARARVLGHFCDPDAAEAVARTARYLDEMVPQVPWRVMLIAVTLGEVQLAAGELADAERWARRAEAALANAPDPGMLRGRTERLRQALERLHMADPITPAERRVLELLPTQLTADQLAARLFVSANTVKTHMKSLYLKLGVTTRTAAVERARELGLLS